MDRSPVSISAYGRLLRANRNFRRLWFAQIVSEMGDWLYTVAIYTLLLDLTHSAKSVALALVLQVLPQFFVSPAAGLLNDRVSRKKVMIGADLARAAIVLGMLAASHADRVWLIYALLLLETLMWAFFEPGRSAVVPNIAEGDDLVVADSLSSMTWSINLAVGSGLGGAVAALFGRDAVFVVNSLSFLLSALLLSGMRFSEPHLAGAKPLRGRDLVDFTPMAEGIRYVLRDRRLLSLLLCKAGLGLMATHWVLIPIFGERIFPVHASGIDAQSGAMLGMSALFSSRGIGALLGPLVGGYWAGRDRTRLRRGIAIGFLFGAAGYLMLAWAPSLALASLAQIITHAGGSTVWVFSTTLLQQHTDDRFRGRVFSADFACMVLTMSVTTYASGVLVDAGVGVRTLAAATGLAALLPTLWWALKIRRWREA